MYEERSQLCAAENVNASFIILVLCMSVSKEERSANQKMPNDALQLSRFF